MALVLRTYYREDRLDTGNLDAGSCKSPEERFWELWPGMGAVTRTGQILDAFHK